MSSPAEHVSSSLRHRVRVLGELLGETMTEQFGEEFLNKIEGIRSEAKERRSEQRTQKAQMLGALKGLGDEDLVAVTRAFNQFLNLANIAEQVETAAGAHRLTSDASHLNLLFGKLCEEGKTAEEIAAAVLDLRCDLVLTANSTGITRRTLLQKYERIASLLERMEEERQDDELRTELRRLVAEVWYTDEIRGEVPVPQEEAKWGFAIVENSFWQAIPALWRGLDDLLRKHTGQALPIEYCPVKISSWMGGDREGNLSVNTDVTREVLRLARWMAADLYLRDIELLLSQLSMSRCTPELEVLAGVRSREPYRVVLRDLRERLTRTRLWAEEAQPFEEDLIVERRDLFDPLYTCFRSLSECGMGVIADGLLKDTLIRIACFGVNLVDLDIRQSARKHALLLSELTEYLGVGRYLDWSESERQSFLLGELENRRPLIPTEWRPSEEAEEVLRSFQLLAEVEGHGVGNYVISRAQDPSDVLTVILLLRKCGLQQALPVVPLFETLDDLDNASWTLERLFHIPWYLEHVQHRQQVMIGYSGSAKDAGQLAAAWVQYRAQEDMVDRCQKADIELTLFHGRGGLMGRGGQSAHQAILSQPPGAVAGRIRLAEQGEMVRFKYGSPNVALPNLDLILSATIEATLLPPAGARPEWRRLMDQLAESARGEYRRIVHEDEHFFEYFEQGTPERELGRLLFGPATTWIDPGEFTESGKGSVANLHTVPWLVSWSQNRMMLPAWLGTERALLQFQEEGKLHLLQEMLTEWPFFRLQIDMLEALLSKADVAITAYYDETLVDLKLKYLGDLLREKLALLIRLINELKQQERLLERESGSAAAMDLRNPYTDPLHFLQAVLVERQRRSESANPQLDRALLETMIGIAASMRDTG